MDLAAIRLSYTKSGLLESEVHPNPIKQFQAWFNQALAAEITEPNAMVLATVSPDGYPQARTVLLKSFDSKGFVFYTNYESRKGRDLAENPCATLLFYWGELERQVRISGTASKLGREESETYFRSRPVGHQLGAWASRQSTVVPDRETLERSLAEAAARFEGDLVPLPSYWGGYVVAPYMMEFWQGRPNRLHDRIEYCRSETGWTIRRLSP
jgi:pyridoxamine 5'-phosphate oxidase